MSDMNMENPAAVPLSGSAIRLAESTAFQAAGTIVVRIHTETLA
ncbi:hypothetical protein [Aureimonas phyllosphaerae]|uniref:Uncharacterized protein n=1 Tax=Aureimonas phyllosphaerae TaxID=1166078 RepID=A0A7W6C3N3_9HYPH|nr:hypothetical protein [Aureimonas phyllosphaerae]MBB3937857.1 hypothetical protein [Aureimonas phyllosphaerae]MBB3961812.1 hypothetical protein [Aureimonas phyllosphaerae]SFF50622.1 hypothetical protein SAMN05216566_11910 [Aureimonas phyllosphaerae]